MMEIINFRLTSYIQNIFRRYANVRSFLEKCGTNFWSVVDTSCCEACVRQNNYLFAIAILNAACFKGVYIGGIQIDTSFDLDPNITVLFLSLSTDV